MGLATHLVTRAGLVALLLAVPGGAAFALAILDSSLTITNLTIKPTSGSVSFETPLDTSFTTHAFNSVGEEVFNGNSGTGADVSTDAAMTFAQRSAQALASNNSSQRLGLGVYPGGTVLAGVNMPGAGGDRSGLFDINGVSTPKRAAPTIRSAAPAALRVPPGAEASSDFRTSTVALRKGARWSDGAPFTADDIVFWYKDVLLNKDLTPALPGWIRDADGSPAKLEKIDDYSVRFTYNEPATLFLTALANADGADRSFAVFLPAHYLKKFHPANTSKEEIDRQVQAARQGVPAPWLPYFPGIECATKYTQFDRDQTNKLLDQLGLTKRDAQGIRVMANGKPVTIEIGVVPAFGAWPDVAQLVAKDWQEVGVNAVAQIRERSLEFSMRDANELMAEVWNEDTTAFSFTGNAKFDPRNPPILTLGPLFAKWVTSNGGEGMEPPPPIKRGLRGSCVLTSECWRAAWPLSRCRIPSLINLRLGQAG